MSHCATIPMYVNPAIAAALEQLGILLDDYHYSQHARGRILAYTAANGTPTGCPELDPGDEHDAEMVFVAELPEVPFDSGSWDRPDAFLDAAMLAEGTHPLPFDGPGAPCLVPIRPIAGGAPGPEEPPFEPTAADLEDYAAWSAELDRRRELEEIEEMCRWYDVHPLGEFNAIRVD